MDANSRPLGARLEAPPDSLYQVAVLAAGLVAIIPDKMLDPSNSRYVTVPTTAAMELRRMLDRVMPGLVEEFQNGGRGRG